MIADKLQTIAENEQKVYSAGKKAEYDAFWDAFQNKGNRRNYYYAFAWQQKENEGWATDTYNPKYPIIADQSVGGAYACQSIFHYSSRMTDAKVPITLKNGKAINTFYNNYWLKNIPSLTLDNVTSFKNTFMNCNALETLIVHGTIAAMDVTNGFNVQWSTKLTHDSLVSIINALEDKSEDTSGTSWIITLGSENVAKLTDDEKDIAEQKGWTIE